MIKDKDMSKQKQFNFVFKKHQNIGAAAAEDDTRFLRECFYDSGTIEVLKDTQDKKCILVGRTGSGKTTLLLRMKEIEGKNASHIDPESLSLQYLSNSSIISYLTDLGINLNIFYKLLWKHIFAVELIRVRFTIQNEQDSSDLFSRFKERWSRDRKKQDAIAYLTKWGGKFWEDMEVRIKEITNKLDESIEAALEGKWGPIKSKFSKKEAVSQEEKQQIAVRIQDVVNKIQISDLNSIINLLAEYFDENTQKKTYLLIDRLDEDWVDNAIRYRLIKSLIEAIRDFSRIPSCKIIVALRRDLLDRVIRLTRDDGFQEEKYRAFYLSLSWQKGELLQILDKRVSMLIRDQYTTQRVGYRDILPNSIDSEEIDDFFVNRTMYRPRDIVEFFNCCLSQAVDKSKINTDMLRKAEQEYSTYRYRSLGDEWSADYPEFLDVVGFFKNSKRNFRIKEIDNNKLSDLCLSLATSYDEKKHKGEIYQRAFKVVNDGENVEDFKLYLMRVMYILGVLGLKTSSSTPVSWSFTQNTPISPAEITNDTRAYICPIFYRVLGINPHE